MLITNTYDSIRNQSLVNFEITLIYNRLKYSSEFIFFDYKLIFKDEKTYSLYGNHHHHNHYGSALKEVLSITFSIFPQDVSKQLLVLSDGLLFFLLVMTNTYSLVM